MNLHSRWQSDRLVSQSLDIIQPYMDQTYGCHLGSEHLGEVRIALTMGVIQPWDRPNLKVLATIPYFNFHFFPHLLIFLQFRDPSNVLNLSTHAVLQKWHI